MLHTPRSTSIVHSLLVSGCLFGLFLSINACSTSSIDPVAKRYSQSTKHLQRGQSYHRSWQRTHNQRYLALSMREFNAAATNLQQAKTGMGRTAPSYYPFYRQQTRICHHMTRLQQQGKYYGQPLSIHAGSGCR